MSTTSIAGSGGAPQTHFGPPEDAKSNNREVSAFGTDANFRDPFWDYADIKKDHWNQSYPYRLALYTKTINSQTNKLIYTRADDVMPSYTLPIPPESLSIATPFAISTTVTLGGIVEEHNGAPLRTITIQGTTGILPLRGNVNSNSLNIKTSIFAGTLNSVNTLVKSAQSIGKSLQNNNVVNAVELASGPGGQGTGYYQFQLLQRWFESYMAFKKTTAGKDFVMALEFWKDDAVYLVTPVMFEVVRSVANPLEYKYSMQFRAWKRVKLVQDGSNTFFHAPVARDPNKLFKTLNTLQEARQVLQNAKNVLRSVRADIDLVLFTPLRQGILFCKDILGVVNTAVDFPANIITDLKEPILEAVTLKNSVSALGANIQAFPAKVNDAFKNLSVQVSKAEAGSGQINTSRQGINGAAPASKIAANPDGNFDFFNGVKPFSLNLRPETRQKIEVERTQVQTLKREDFEASRDSAVEVLTDFEAAVGAGNATYDRIYNITSRPSTRVPTDSDFDVIFALNRVVMEFSRLAASSTINRNEINSIDYFAGLATQSGIAFKVPNSKFLVPFMYGHTLEMLSALYLGTPDRWHEIAALNGLQAPYVDETGFILTLLTNGNGNTVTVSDISNLYVNQQVWISSTVVARTVRRISKINQLSPTLYIVTVTGDQDLNQYTLAAGATLQAFLPNTVNSQMSLYIPSDEQPADEDFRQKSIPGINYFDPLVRAGGIDLLLTSKGDLVITPDGDTRLAVGLTNIVQKVRLVLDTPRGSLLHHPDYGFPIQVGMSTADLSAQDILNLSKDLFKGDPTFSGVVSAAVLKDGPLVKMSLAVGIAGTSSVVPITVDIPR